MKIEVFVSDCDLCCIALNRVRKHAPEGAEVLRRDCEDDRCCHAGIEQGIHTVVPSISIDGQVAHQGKLTEKQAEDLFE